MFAPGLLYQEPDSGVASQVRWKSEADVGS
jgi:hypothetical protein